MHRNRLSRVCQTVLFFCVVFLLSSASTYAQKSLNDYAYVVIPRQFDFQLEKDQYRLNSLLRHLFNSHGFHALYELEREKQKLPLCEGVYAVLENQKSLLATKLVILIKDCEDKVLFTSAEGKSKEKAHDQSYAEALREAFGSIAALGVSQKPLDAVSHNTGQEAVVESEAPQGEKPVRYTRNQQFFELRKTTNGWTLHNVSAHTEVGRLQSTSRRGIYLFVNEDGSSLASFDDRQNLLIDTVDADGNPRQELYHISP